MKKSIDIVVIGGGHAGVEAALVASRMGIPTLLITPDKNDIAKMPCNPSIGGLAKSHLVYELDALGGEMGLNADETALQKKTLNSSRGPAVRATRAQCDKQRYSQRMQTILSNQPNLSILEDVVIGIRTAESSIDPVNNSEGSSCNEESSCNTPHRRITGVITDRHGEIEAKAIVIASGTSLRGKIFIGHSSEESGGDNRPAANRLSESLEELGFRLIRLKTGTPPRLKASSCDFSKCIEQPGESPPPMFSLRSSRDAGETGKCSTKNNCPQMEHPPVHMRSCSTWNTDLIPNISCWMTHTTPETHEIIRNHLKDSALYGGPITGTGVRYCPSIEDKIVRFKEASQHHVMLEPEDAAGTIIYPNGLSCSLPKNIQEKLVRSVPGLEQAEFIKYAYAIEYDGIDARELKHSLESKRIEGLFFAGQVNGTTGYEEAGAQGIMAGINAAFKVKREEPLVLSRQDAYIGVMIDDLVTKGTDEPYRMFTSRAERRLILRQDNARYRLMDAAERVGVLPESIRLETRRFKELIEANLHCKDISGLPGRVVEQIMIMRQYEGYIKQEEIAAERAKRDEAIKIPMWLDYDKCPAVRFESREKLKKWRPETLAQASRIPGVNPADIAVLAVIIRRGHH